MKPKPHELYYRLGCVLYQQSDLAGAVENHQRSIAICPNFVDAHQGLGIVLDAQGRWLSAVQSYRRAIALQGNHAAAYNNLGCTLVKLGELEAAIEACQKAIVLNPAWAAPHQNLGQALLAQGRVNEALTAFSDAIRLEPTMAGAHYGLAGVLQLQGQHSQAVRSLQRAVNLAPDQAEIFGECAAALMAQGRLEQATVYLRDAIVRQKIFVESYCKRADRLAEQDDLTLAQANCAQLLHNLQHEADASQISLLLQQIYICLGKVMSQYGGRRLHQQAELYYREALKIQPQNGEVYWLLGNCFAQQQRLQQAVESYRSALTFASGQPEIYFCLGHVLEKLCQPEEAIDCYRQSLALQQPESRWLSREQWQLKSYPLRFPSYQLPASNRSSTSNDAGCDGLNCASCLEQIFHWFQPLHLGSGIYGFFNQPVLPDESSLLYTSVIPKGRTWIAPQKNFWLICNAIATFTPDHHLLLDLSRDYPGQLPGCQGFNPNHHRIFDLETMPPLEQIDGTVAVLAGLSGHVYFHWMTDILPRIEILRHSGINLKRIDWFLVNSDRQSFQRETLELLGIPEEKILSSDRHPHIQARRLVVPSFPGPIGWMQPWALSFLRRVFLPVAAQKRFPERIYISRADARYRRVLNEEEVVEELSKIGFEAVVLESFSVTEQIALFANASAIVAPHGSGLTNLVFCRPGTKVIELFSPHYVRHYYWVISNGLKLEYYYMVGVGFACRPLRELMYQNPLTEDFLIDLQSLRKMIKFTRLLSSSS